MTKAMRWAISNASVNDRAVRIQEHPAGGTGQVNPGENEQHQVPAAPLDEPGHGRRKDHRAHVAGHVHHAENQGHVLAAHVHGDGVGTRGGQAFLFRTKTDTTSAILILNTYNRSKVTFAKRWSTTGVPRSGKKRFAKELAST